MATVDVIIPAYNAAKYLPYALDSVIAQTFEDWRVVLVDDGSTDTTPGVIEPYIERLGAKLTYLQQSNRGMSAARNVAIRASDAEFIAFLDADDVWLPCRLSESVQVLRARQEVALTYGGITLIDTQGHPGETFTGTLKNAATRIASQIFTREIHLPCVTVTFRRQCIDEVGLFDESMRATEDRDLWLRIALRHDVAFIPKALAYYRISPNSMTTDPERMLQAQLKFIRRYYGSPGCGLRLRQVALARAYTERAETYKKRRLLRKALKSSLRAVALNPFSVETIKPVGSIVLSWVLPRLQEH
jgi:glycosyltransferase involved in cell wall biosynthesis